MEKQAIQKIQVGETLTNLELGYDYYLMEYNELDGIQLYVVVNNLSEKDLEIFQNSSTVEFSFGKQKGVGFFSVDFGHGISGDCPFSPNLYNETPVFNSFEDGKGLPLLIIFVEGKTGVIKGLRMIGMNTRFSNKFCEMNNEMLKNEDMDDKLYNLVIDEVYSKYTASQLKKRAFISYKHKN